MDFLGLFILLAGLIVGLGAVTVIDLHGFLGRKSSYWTVATTRTHKVTKPLIWLGTGLVAIGWFLFFKENLTDEIPMLIGTILFALILNGLFLSGVVSPYLLKREKQGKDGELLSKTWQLRITMSFIVSFAGWWSAVALIAWHITQQL